MNRADSRGGAAAPVVGQKFREQIFRSSPTAPRPTRNHQAPAHHRTSQSATRHEPCPSRSPRPRRRRTPASASSSHRRPSEVRLRLRGSPSLALCPLPARARPPVTRLPPPGWPAAGLAQAPSGLGQAASCPGQVVGCLASRFDLRPDGIGDDEGNASGGGHCARWLFNVLTQRRFAS